MPKIQIFFNAYNLHLPPGLIFLLLTPCVYFPKMIFTCGDSACIAEVQLQEDWSDLKIAAAQSRGPHEDDLE